MGIFSQSGSSDCPARPSTAGGEAQPIAGSLTFHQIIIIIGWVCIALTTCLWLGLLLPHLRQYARPNEQRQALRIILTPVVFAIASILSMHFYHAAQYIAPIASLYEAYALASLFLLYVHYVTPESSSREEYFQGLDRLARSGKIKSGGSLRWFRKIWQAIFFYCLLYTIVIIIQEVLEATGAYCDGSTKPKFGHIWLQAIELAVTVCAVIALIMFYKRLRSEMAHHKPRGKLISFKIVVIVSTLQRFIFSILSSRITGNAKVTYDDLTIGLPALLTCVEAVFFTAGFYCTFSWRKCLADNVHKEYQAAALGFGEALVDSLNPTDWLHGIQLSFVYLRGRKGHN